jgi:hypothetical protein
MARSCHGRTGHERGLSGPRLPGRGSLQRHASPSPARPASSPPTAAMLAPASASARSAVDLRLGHAAAAPLTTDPRSAHSVAAPRRATKGHHEPPAPRPGTARSPGRRRGATTPTSSGDRRAARPPASSRRCRRRAARTGLSRAQPDGAREATVTGGQRGGRTPARPDPPAGPGVGRPGNPTSTSHARSADLGGCAELGAGGRITP